MRSHNAPIDRRAVLTSSRRASCGPPKRVRKIRVGARGRLSRVGRPGLSINYVLSIIHSAGLDADRSRRRPLMVPASAIIFYDGRGKPAKPGQQADHQGSSPAADDRPPPNVSGSRSAPTMAHGRDAASRRRLRSSGATEGFGQGRPVFSRPCPPSRAPGAAPSDGPRRWVERAAEPGLLPTSGRLDQGRSAIL